MNYYKLGGRVCASWLALELERAEEDEKREVSWFLFDRDPSSSRASFAVSNKWLLYQEEEDARWLSERELEKNAQPLLAERGDIDALLAKGIEEGKVMAVNMRHPQWPHLLRSVQKKKQRVHILALGDVGSHLLIGLHLLGADVIESIGIFDLNPKVSARWEVEVNQIMGLEGELPRVEVIDEDALFDCDVFIFVASAGVPEVGREAGDVRMIQLEKNTAIISSYARKARAAHFQGLFCEVADPVDPLARAAWRASNTDEDGNFDGLGLRAEQIQGYGLGVMNARATYYAQKDPRFARFLTEGRVFGAHGKELVVADSIERYDDEASKALTTLAIEANLRVRELGYKPFVAPAYSSGVLAILATLRGQWHYGSVFLGGSFMGVKNRYTPHGQEHEILPLPQKLMERILDTQESLRAIN